MAVRRKASPYRSLAWSTPPTPPVAEGAEPPAAGGATASREAGPAAAGVTAPRVGGRVRDLVDVAAVRTVVRLTDLDDPDLEPGLATSFVLTSDAEHCLRTVLRDVRSGRGHGYFLEGSFGSGKSHLMAVLLGLLRGSLGTESLGAALGEGVAPRAAGLTPADLPERPLLVVPVSLVEFASRETLQEAVLHGVARAAPGLLGAAGGPAPNRREAFAAIVGHLRASGTGGLLLCLDELSEFLRSKPDGRAFAEDVRFLQFLGEWAETAPAWILCSAQEAIEQTGELPAPVFSRIRDRYPVRFRLGGGHIKELVCRRLISKRPGAGPALESLYAGLHHTFGGLPFSAEDFMRLYPVHPATVELLDELRPLFSQQRGVIDFIVARLGGDPARRIPPFLDQPADRLLGPDSIVEHFRDRVRERPETAQLATVALPYFEREMARLFPDEETARLAGGLGRVLIAGALCPTPRAFTARELADALLHRLTDLDPALNYELVAETLERMAAEGAYVGRRQAADGGATAYFCDLQADLSLVVRRRLDYWRSGLLPDDARTWSALLPWCEDASVPLSRLAAQPRSLWDVTWRRTPRRVLVWLTQLSALEAADAREVARTLETSETDVVVFVAASYPGEPEAAPLRWEAEIAPALLALHPALPALAWIPRAPTVEEAERLRDAVAHALLEAEVAADRSATAERLRAHLQGGVPALRRDVGLLYRELYLQGSLRNAEGDECDLARLGAQPFAALLEAACDAPLRRRFPLHPDLPGRPELLVPAAVERAVGELSRGGDAGDAPLDPASRGVLDQFLVPLGLCRRGARGYRLTVDPRVCPLGGDVLAAVEGASAAAPVRVDEVYGRLRKGDAGLHRRVFELLCYTLVQSGAVAAARSGRRLPPAQVRLSGLWEVDGLAPGALVDPALQQGLEGLPFLPPRLRRGPLTYALQREAWEAVVDWKRQWAAALPTVRSELATVRDFPSLRGVLTPDWLGELDRLEDLLSAVMPSLPAQEGLQRLLEAFAARPGAPRTLERAAALREFMERRLAGYLHMVNYLDGGDFAPPEPLREQAAELLALVRDADVVLGEGYPSAEAAFAALRQGHAEAYAAAHAAAVSPAAFAAHEDVQRGASYRLAGVLGDIPGLQADPDAVTLHEAARAALALRCERDRAALADRLRRLPCCECGYRLDRPPMLPPAQDLRDLATHVAAGYLAALQRPEHAERLRAYAEGLAAVGRADAAGAMRRLLDLDPADAAAAGEALACVERAGVAEVRSALAGQALVEEREAAALLARLAGRALRPEQALAAMREWLGELGAGSFVRMVGEPSLAGAPRGADPAVARAPSADVRSAPPRWAGPGAPGGLALAPLGAGTSAGSMADAAARCTAGVDLAEESLAALHRAAADPPRGAEAWAALWLGPAGRWARILAELRDDALAAGRLAELPLLRWELDAAECTRRLQRPFAAALATVPPGERGGLAGGVARARALARRGGGGVYVWCLDGMRADLVDLVLDALGRGGVRLSEAERGASWAAAPTTTAPQFEALRISGFRGELLRWEEGSSEALAAGGRQVLAELDWSSARTDGCIWKWDFIDAKVHASTDGFASFCAEVRVQVTRRVLPAFVALARGARVVLCADHGFRRAEGPAALAGEAPRYLHGGESLDEVLAPWSVLERA